MAVKQEPPRRLSRVESQAQTRARLMDAAETAFAMEGFGGASLDRIAEEAGLTRGAVYSNFSDKADLFVAVLHRRFEHLSAEIAKTMSALDSPEAFVAMLRAGRSYSDVDRRWVLLYDEFRLFALRNPQAAQRLADHERVVRDDYVRAITYLLGQLGVEPPADPRLLAAIIFALDGNLYRQHCIDPDDVPSGAFVDAVDLLLRAAVALDVKAEKAPDSRAARRRSR